jgi:glycosyltransferase involved in cell wall biosynthesis
VKIAILFTNIGTYHTARLLAAREVLESDGHELLVIQLSNNTFDHPWGTIPRERELKIETLLDGSYGTSVGGRYWKKAGVELEQALKRHRPEIIFVPGWGFPCHDAVLRYKNSSGVSLVLMSESKQNDKVRVWFAEYFKERLLRKYSAALVGGGAHRDYLIGLGMQRDKIFFGYNVVDNDYFRQAIVERKGLAGVHGAEPPQRYFLCVTRFLRRKNVKRLVAAYDNYYTKTGDQSFPLMICGEGNQRSEIMGEIEKRSLLHKITLAGFVPYEASLISIRRHAHLYIRRCRNSGVWS